MKRVISFILVAALLLGLIAMAVSVASAEALPTVEGITVSNEAR